MEIVENLPEHKQAVSVEQKTVESATKEEPAHKVLLGGTPKEISLLNKLVDRQRT